MPRPPEDGESAGAGYEDAAKHACSEARASHTIDHAEEQAIVGCADADSGREVGRVAEDLVGAMPRPPEVDSGTDGVQGGGDVWL